MQDAKEEVRSRLNIEDVIGEYVQLKRAGRNFKGLSPFSSEKTPSFFVSPDKHIWHDFSSNKGGDIFAFIMEVEGLDFKSSLEYLARKAGVDLSMYETKGSQDVAKRKKRLLLANELAANYYQQSLLKNQHALEYVFKKRGLSKKIVQDFKIGYAPDSGNALVQFLAKKGFSAQELTQAGLTNRFGGDLFRGRMTISLMDSTGQVIGFTGRVINDDPNSPKYLNTPQTLLYDKGRHVFGLSQAKDIIRETGYAVIVEGNLDVISSHQVGISQVVATAGTAMTEYHLRALVRLSGNIKLAFDADKAGLAATERAIPIAQGVGVDLAIITLPGGVKDPDELIKKDIKLWQKAIDGSIPAVEWIIEQYSLREDLTSAVGKRKFTTVALDVVRMLNDPVEQEHYMNKISEISGISVDTLRDKLAFGDEKPDKKYKEISVSVDPKDESLSYQDSLLAIALISQASQELFKDIDIEIFDGDERRAVAEFILKSENYLTKDTPKELQKYDTYVKILLLRADARYADWNDKDRYREMARLIRQVTNDKKKKLKDKLTEELREAEVSGDDTKADEIRGQIYKLIKEIQNGQR